MSLGICGFVNRWFSGMCGEGGCHISLCVQCGANEKVKLATGLWLTGLNNYVSQ